MLTFRGVSHCVRLVQCIQSPHFAPCLFVPFPAPYPSSLSFHPSPLLPPQTPQWYYLEFDGASKGNPGPAGAGAVVRDAEGREVSRGARRVEEEERSEAMRG